MLANRIHLFEIEDLSACPAVIRDGITDTLQCAINLSGNYLPVVPLLEEALRRSGASRIVDLCSGAGGPWPTLLPALRAHAGKDVRVLLTDRYPNESAFKRLSTESEGCIDHHAGPVSAFDVPAGLDGFRTVFTGFHHFRPEQGAKILEDAVRKREGIGIFEFTSRRPLPLLFTLLMAPLGPLLLTPRLKPVRWSRVLLTYLVPVLPLCTLFDGTVSCLRTYSIRELQALIDALPDNDYQWQLGELGERRRQPVTYLLGYPGS
jgi:hypothetical protein